MKDFNLHNPMENIDFILNNLIHFSNENEFDFILYKAFADETSKSFNRYFSQVGNETDKEKIISDLNSDLHFIVDNIVTNSLGSDEIRILGYENNYKQLKQLFINSVEYETYNKTQHKLINSRATNNTKSNIEFKKILNDIDILTNIYDQSFKAFFLNREFSKFEYLQDFVDEVNDNFLKNINKNDTLKYYLSELSFLNRYFNVDNYDLIIKNNSTELDLSLSEKGLLEAYYIFEIILDEITLCCFKYDLDFYKLCDEINFDYSYLDVGLIDVSTKESLKDISIKENKLSINQIALKLVYSNSTVNKENADSTIKEYGHNSGHKLYQAFNFYYKKANRIGHDVESETKKILDNKIKLLESVIELVQDDFKQKAIDECKTLRSHLFKY